jgi:hypothetical protein
MRDFFGSCIHGLFIGVDGHRSLGRRHGDGGNFSGKDTIRLRLSRRVKGRQRKAILLLARKLMGFSTVFAKLPINRPVS